MADARAKRLRVMVDLLMADSSSDEDAEPSRVDADGRHVRRNGWKPQPQQQPGAAGIKKWRVDWSGSKLDKIMQRTDLYHKGSFGAKLFRSRLGVPRVLFDDLLAECRSYPEIKDHCAGDGQGIHAPSTVPLWVKLGAALNWMRQGGAMVSAADFAGMDPQTMRRFVRRWAAAVVHVQYPQHVKVPEGSELVSTLQLHARMGFPGMLAGTDGVDVMVTGVPWVERDRHRGKACDTLTRGFNVSGSARRKIFHVEGSFDGGTNDKTKSRYDQLMQDLHTRAKYRNVAYELYVALDGRSETEVGLWLLTDNGYHFWRSTQFPSKYPYDDDDLAWSARSESVRKPSSECIFGILKKRSRLFAGVFDFGNLSVEQYKRSVPHFDNLFRVACMLHNRLQEHDGIADLGDHEDDWRPVNLALDIDRRMRRLRAEAEHGASLPPLRHMFVVQEGDEVQYDMEHDVLHRKLVTHYTAARHLGEVKWLRTAKASRGLRRDCRPLLPGHRLHSGESNEVELDDDAIYESDLDEGADGDAEDE